MNDLNVPDETEGFEGVKEQVRRRLSWRLERLLDSVDEVFRDDPASMTAGMVSAYTGAVKTYGSLWRATDPPVDTSGMVPAHVVERMLESERVKAATEALEAERARVREESQRVLEAAGSRTRTRLEEFRAKRELPAAPAPDPEAS